MEQKNKTPNLGLMLAFGVAIGLGIGVFLDNIPLGLMAGIALSLVLSGVLIWWLNREEEN